MFRPCIDLHAGKVKQIVGSSLNTADDAGLITNYESEKDSSYYAELYKNDGLKGGHVIMLGQGNETASISALKSYPGGLQVGGGINPSNALQYLEVGASHVIVTSYVFSNGKIDFEKLNEILSVVGKSRLVLDLSCRKKDDKYYVVTDRWTKFTDYEVNCENLKHLSQFCDEFLVHAVDVEGKCNGILEDIIEILSDSVIPVTYAGGIRNLEDLELVKQKGKGKVCFTIGSALDIFGGNLSYKQVIEWNSKNK